MTSGEAAEVIAGRTERKGACLEWGWGFHRYGYGRVKVAGRYVLAHRLAWYAATGEWPSACVLHRCDNPPCVLIDHLFLGSRADNNRDREEKGRGRHPGAKNPASGLAHPAAKLTAEQVRALRAGEYGGSKRACKALGMTRRAVIRAKRGISYRDVL